jgi:chromosome segregation ATPase
VQSKVEATMAQLDAERAKVKSAESRLQEAKRKNEELTEKVNSQFNEFQGVKSATERLQQQLEHVKVGAGEQFEKRGY